VARSFPRRRRPWRYEPVALDEYLAIFQSIDAHPLEEWIRSEPTSIFVGRAWYLYELLMEKQLDVPDVMPSCKHRSSRPQNPPHRTALPRSTPANQ
jgi:hypothetical protein